MKSFKLVLFYLVLIPFLSSCDDDDDDNLTFDKNNIGMIVGQSLNVAVKGGDGTYTVKSSDDKIATAKISDKNVVINAVKEGNVSFTINDKSGKKGSISVIVKKDPYEAVKNDAKIRFVWDKISKIKDTDKGTYAFSQSKEGKVEFNWKSEDGKSTIVLNFTDKAGSIAVGDKKDAKLLIDGKEVKVESLSVIQNKVVNANEKATVWIVFNADKKEGVCVGQLSE